MESFILFLFCHFLNREESVFPHLYSLGHVAHTGIFCKRKFNCYHVCRVRWLGTEYGGKHPVILEGLKNCFILGIRLGNGLGIYVNIFQ